MAPGQDGAELVRLVPLPELRPLVSLHQIPERPSHGAIRFTLVVFFDREGKRVVLGGDGLGADRVDVVCRAAIGDVVGGLDAEHDVVDRVLTELKVGIDTPLLTAGGGGSGGHLSLLSGMTSECTAV